MLYNSLGFYSFFLLTLIPLILQDFSLKLLIFDAAVRGTARFEDV